jgi:hypothetical protein
LGLSHSITSCSDRRDLLKQTDVLERLKRYVTLATIGTELQKPNDPGYMATLAGNLRGDPKTLKKRCEDTNASAIISTREPTTPTDCEERSKNGSLLRQASVSRKTEIDAGPRVGLELPTSRTRFYRIRTGFHVLAGQKRAQIRRELSSLGTCKGRS